VSQEQCQRVQTGGASLGALPKPPTTIVLVRHGQTPTTGRLLPGQAPGLHLSDEGKKQAEAAAARIAKLKRARETAMPIARARGLAVRVERGLMDLDVGTWTGARLDKVSKRPEWSTVQRHPSGFRFPDGESFMEMQARMTETLAKLVERHRGGVVVAVSHADPIKAVVAHALGMHLDLFQRLNVSPGSITTIAYSDGAPMVLGVNALGDGMPG
jgi:probable phosphomutase (TIGR03848 family)